MLIFLHLTTLFLFLRDISRFSTMRRMEYNSLASDSSLLIMVCYNEKFGFTNQYGIFKYGVCYNTIFIHYFSSYLPRNPNQECKINAESNYNSGPLQFILHVFLHVLDAGSEFYHIQVGKIPTSNLVQLMLGSIKEIKMLICKECLDRSVILMGPRGWAFSALALALWNLLPKNQVSLLTLNF